MYSCVGLDNLIVNLNYDMLTHTGDFYYLLSKHISSLTINFITGDVFDTNPFNPIDLIYLDDYPNITHYRINCYSKNINLPCDYHDICTENLEPVFDKIITSQNYDAFVKKFNPKRKLKGDINADTDLDKLRSKYHLSGGYIRKSFIDVCHPSELYEILDSSAFKKFNIYVYNDDSDTTKDKQCDFYNLFTYDEQEEINYNIGNVCQVKSARKK